MLHEWQLFIPQIHLIKTYGHEGMHDTFSLVCVQNDQDSADYILGTTAQSEAEKLAKERLVHVNHNHSLLARS